MLRQLHRRLGGKEIARGGQEVHLEELHVVGRREALVEHVVAALARGVCRNAGLLQHCAHEHKARDRHENRVLNRARGTVPAGPGCDASPTRTPSTPTRHEIKRSTGSLPAANKFSASTDRQDVAARSAASGSKRQ